MATLVQIPGERLWALGKFDGMVYMTGRMPKLPSIPLQLRVSSSLGHLCRLPPELMLNLIAQMDFLAIVRFSQVSVQANG